MKKPTFGSTKPCTVLDYRIGSFRGRDVGMNFDEILYDMFELGDKLYGMANCSTRLIPDIKLGSKLENGSWDGAIGFLERGEVNATSLGYPIGTIDDAPFHVGSVYWSTELSIVSMKPEAKNVTVGLESWGTIFDHHTYTYLFLCIILFSLWYVVSLTMNQFICDCIIKSDRTKMAMEKYIQSIKNKNRKRTRKENLLDGLIKRGFITFPKIVSSSMLALVDEQQIPAPNNFSSRILLSTYFVAIFNLMFGFFGNCISVDMVAIQPVPAIDTLKQLIFDYKDVDVVTIGGLWHESALKGSLSGSLERHLADRIPAENYVPALFDSSLVESVAKHVLNIAAGNEVGVIDRQAIPMLLSAICQEAEYIDISRVHISSDWFGERLLAPMISLSSDNELLHWSRYKFRQLFQSFIFQNTFRDAYKTITLDQSASLFKKIVCVEGRRKGREINPPDSFQLTFFTPLIMLCLKIITLAFIILIGEILISSLKRTAEKFLE